MDPSYYDVWIFFKNITVDIVLFLGAKFSSHRAAMENLDFCSNTNVVALRLSFPTHGHGPHSDTRGSSYGPQTKSCAFSSLYALFMHFLQSLTSWTSSFTSLGFCLVNGLKLILN